MMDAHAYLPGVMGAAQASRFAAGVSPPLLRSPNQAYSFLQHQLPKSPYLVKDGSLRRIFRTPALQQSPL